jgi:hypothetical protein
MVMELPCYEIDTVNMAGWGLNARCITFLLTALLGRDSSDSFLPPQYRCPFANSSDDLSSATDDLLEVVFLLCIHSRIEFTFFPEWLGQLPSV